MTIREMQERKRELGYSNLTLSQKSGVPLSTVQKVLGGKTRSPRRATIQALEAVLAKPVSYPQTSPASTSMLQEPAIPYGEETRNLYTIQDIEALPQDVRAELIDGQIYYMSAPAWIHQKIVVEILFVIKSHIKSNHGTCEVCPAPFAVYLNGEEGRDLLEPDLVVICNPDRLHDKGCMGAPDWVMEVISPSTRSRDYAIKLFKYRTAGVREYWIVNPDKELITVYRFDQKPEVVDVYHFDEDVPFSIFPDLSVRLADLL